MNLRRVLLLIKRSAFDLYVKRHQEASIIALHQAAGNLQDRHKVHEITVKTCESVLDKRDIHWRSLFRDELRGPINNVDLVIAVGGDGTLLEVSHYLDSCIPVLGVNSDPTQNDEVEEKLDNFDATRSAGYLCAATRETFGQVLEEINEGKRLPVHVPRISARVNGTLLKTYALNDILVAHPNPAAVTRCTFSIQQKCTLECVSPLVHSRSSGLRVCTGIGSTAAMRSAGGYSMPPSSTELQYMVREPITPHPSHREFMHRVIKAEEMLQIKFTGRKGNVYFDGSHSHYPIQFGDIIELSSGEPYLQIFLRD